jgi:hypothetical protein
MTRQGFGQRFRRGIQLCFVVAGTVPLFGHAHLHEDSARGTPFVSPAMIFSAPIARSRLMSS